MPTLNKIIKEVQEMFDSYRVEAYNTAIADVIVLLLGMKKPKMPVTYIVCKLTGRHSLYAPSYKVYRVNNSNFNFVDVINDKDYWYLGTNYKDAMKAQVEANKVDGRK